MATTPPVEQQFIRSIVEPWIDTIGRRLVSYVLNVDEPGLAGLLDGTLSPTESQVTSLQILRKLSEVDIPIDSEINRGELMIALISQTTGDGVTLARRIHLNSDGADSSVSAKGAVDEALLAIAVDAYSLFLLPPEKLLLPAFAGMSNQYVVSLIFQHPGRKAFLTGLSEDENLKELFPKTDDDIGSSIGMWRNTGAGGGLQATMIPELVLRAAWRQVRDDPDPEEYTRAVLARMEMVRSALSNGSISIDAIFAFAGVLLPEGIDHVDLPDAVLERTVQSDRELAPEALRQNLSTTDSSGVSTVISYDGDVVCRMQFPLKVRTRTGDPSTFPTEWPADMRFPEEIERRLELIRLSLLFAVTRESRTQIVPTWRFLDDPFAYGANVSWIDSKQFVGLMPTQLTTDEVSEWVEWYKTLSARRMDRIGVATTRVLKALAERREPSDVLIDSVIAWENLFGTSEGEPTLRVTASIALLLGEDVERRKELRTKLKEIYTLRSQVVHGSKPLEPRKFPLCQEALDFAIQAIKVLARDRSDVMDLDDGAARSAHLIMGG